MIMHFKGAEHSLFIPIPIFLLLLLKWKGKYIWLLYVETLTGFTVLTECED